MNNYDNNKLFGNYLMIGKQGSGKTAYLIKILVDTIKRYPNLKIYSNITLFDLPYTRVFLNKDLIEKRRNNLTLNDLYPLQENEIRLNDDFIYVLDTITDNPNYFDNSIMIFDEIHTELNSLDYFRKNSRIFHTFFSQLRKRNILTLSTCQYLLDLDIRIRRQTMNVFDLQNIGYGVFQVTTNEIDGYYSKPINQFKVNLNDYFKYYDTNEIVE